MSFLESDDVDRHVELRDKYRRGGSGFVDPVMIRVAPNGIYPNPNSRRSIAAAVDLRVRIRDDMTLMFRPGSSRNTTEKTCGYESSV